MAWLAVLILTASPALAQPVGWVYVDPACPAPSDRVTFRVATGDYRFVASVTQMGNVFRFVVSYPEGFWAEPIFYPVTVSVGPLAAGNYRVENFRRVATDPGVYGPEVFWGAADFVVEDNPPPCVPRRISAALPAMVTGLVGQQYGQPMVVQVVDAHGLPVSGAAVRWSRVQLNYWATDLPMPEIVGLPTAAPGTYAYAATANSVPGTFLYRAFIEYADEQPSAYFVISNREARDSTSLLPVVEYWHALLNHYFITGSPAEMAKLDDGTIAGWYRTGGVFLAFDRKAARPASVGPVCRFYGRPDAGLNTHF